MDEKIMEYLVQEKHCEPKVVAPMMLAKVSKYAGIRREFEEWLEKRTYRKEDAFEVNGWTAERVAREAPDLDGIGAFNFLVTLRDEPEVAEEIIESGFVTK